MKTFQMDVHKDCLTSWIHLRVLETLSGQTSGVSQRQLSQILGIPNSTLQRVLSSLSETDVIKPLTVGRSINWALNRASYAFDVLNPLIQSLKNVSSPLQYLKKAIRVRLSLSKGYRCYIFGSVAERTDTEASDIDLAIVLPAGRKRLPHSIEERLELLQDFCRDRFGRLLSAVTMGVREFNSSSPSSLVMSVKKGIEI